MRTPRPQAEIIAEINALPRAQREAIHRAVDERRAVDDAALAPLAAEWALSQRRPLLRVFVLGAPPIVVTALFMVWFTSRNDAPLTAGGAVGLGFFIVGLLWLLGWAIWWRPLVRAERANRAKLGLARPPPRREPSHWVVAALASWWIAMIVGALLLAVGVKALSPSVGIIVWFGLAWLIKRGLDSRN